MPPATTSLTPSPTDAITRVTFNPPSTTLALTTWAGTLSLYNPNTGALVVESHHPHALLDTVWTSSTTLATASLSGTVSTATVTSTGVSTPRTLGRHGNAARCVAFCGSVLVSGGWDGEVRFWSVKEGKEIEKAMAGGKVYAMCRGGEYGVGYATSARRVRLVDVRKMSSVLYEREPPVLSYQLRGLCVSDDTRHYVVGSTEGRVAVDEFEGESGFSFKCHRMDEMAFPVNCVVYDRKYGSFATGGGDGYVAFWDGEARKRIAQWGRWATSVSSIEFDAESERIAIAVSYTFEEGEKDCPPDEVHICKVEESCIMTRRAREEAEKKEQNDEQKKEEEEEQMSKR